MEIKKPVKEEPPKREFTRLLGIASTVGINFVVSTFAGVALGYGLDKWFGTSPYLTIIFLILGIIAGFKYFFKIALKTSKHEKQESRGQGVEDSNEK